jgi:hypothetical protein
MFCVSSFRSYFKAGASKKSDELYKKERSMVIRLHSFISNRKRFIQVQSQSYHITGLFRKIIQSSKKTDFFQSSDIKSAYFECVEDSTITFYQAESTDTENPGLWTYVVYECPECEEKVFRDLSIDTSLNPIKKLFSGQKLIQRTGNINEYFQYQYIQDEHLDIRLPTYWNTPEKEQIASLILEELKALKASPIFAEGAGKEYMRSVINEFIQAAQKVIRLGGNLKDFELAQSNVLHQIKIDDIANLILEYNDYRIWLTALPSQSKAVEYVFNTALNLIYRTS